jgi:hypothetical protein
LPAGISDHKPILVTATYPEQASASAA